MPRTKAASTMELVDGPKRMSSSNAPSCARAPASESDTYVTSRNWQRRIGAWPSAQSQPLRSREQLDDAVLAAGGLPRWMGWPLLAAYAWFLAAGLM